MEIRLGINTSENNCINKSVTWIDTINCVIKGNISVVNPTVIASYEGSLKGINYAEISEYGRKYFARITALTGNRIEIECRCDVLSSFSKYILNLRTIIDKQQQLSNANKYINDGSYVVENRDYNSIIPFSNGFNETGEFILICAGGHSV